MKIGWNKPNLPQPHLAQQLRVTIEHREQFRQRQRRLGLAGFVARESVDADAEDGSGFALVERQLSARAGDNAGIDGRGIRRA